MAIKPLTVLPQLKPVTYQDPSQNNQSFRILAEMIQQENANERSRQTGMLAALKEQGDFLDANKFIADSPYQQRVLGRVQQGMQQAMVEMQKAYNPADQLSILNSVKGKLYSDVDYQKALGEQVMAKEFFKTAITLRDEDTNTEEFDKVWARYNDPNRTEAMTARDFNIGKLLTSEDKWVDKFAQSILTKDTGDKPIYDDEKNVRYVIERDVLPPDAKERLIEKMKESVRFQGFGDKEIERRAEMHINNLKSKYSGVRIKDLATSIDEGEKGTADYPAILKGFTTEGTSLSGGKKLRTIDGVMRIYDSKGDEIAKGEKIEDLMGVLSAEDVDKLSVVGAVAKPKFRAGGKVFYGNEFDDYKIVDDVTGLAKDDAALIENQPTKWETKDGWLTTNSPSVISELGYDLSYDPKGGKDKKGAYILTNTETNEVIKEGTGMFKTSGGSSLNKPKMFNIKIEDTPQPQKQKELKNAPVSSGSDDLPELQFIAPEESGAEGDAAINPHDQGAPSIAKTQMNDADTQKEWLGTVGKDGEWGEILKRDTTARQNLEKDYKTKSDALKGVGGEKKEELDEWYKEEKKKLNAQIKKEYQDIYNGLSDEEKEKLKVARNEIMEEKFWEPSRAVFEETFGIEIPDKIRGLWAAMAGQHRKGMLDNKSLVKKINEAAGDGKIKQLIESGDEDAVIDIISDVRADYIEDLNVANKKALLERVERDRARAKGVATSVGTTGNIADPEKTLNSIYNKYPALKKMGQVTLKADPSFTRDKTGAGDIEYFGPKYSGITYPNNFNYKHPKEGTHGIVYNPNTNDEQSIMLDMLHGMKEADPVYAQYRDSFKNAFLESKYSDDLKEQWNEYNKETNGKNDGYGQFVDNWIDGQIRNLMFEGTKADFKKHRYWELARDVYFNDEEIKKTFFRLRDYLKADQQPQQTIPEVKREIVKPPSAVGRPINIRKQ